MSSSSSPEDRKTRVPTTRIERLLRLGTTAGTMAVSAAFDGARKVLAGEPVAARDVLWTPANSQQLVDSLSRMRGAAMKLGQLLSMEGGGFLPPAFTEALATLQADADKMTGAQLDRVLADEYGSDWRRLFSFFDPEPIAAASIGQVHKAISRTTRGLALKIQFPGVAKSIHSDVKSLSTLLKTTGLVPSHFDIGPLIAELERQLIRETDYLREAESLSRFCELLADEPRVRLPRPHDDLTTGRILAMDFIVAEPISVLWEQSFDREVRNTIAGTAQHLVLREIFEFGLMQSDPNFANFMFDRHATELVLLDFGSTVEIEPELSRRYRLLIAAAVEDQIDEICQLLLSFGWVGPEDEEEHIRGLAEFVWLATEPLRTPGVYDYAASDLPDRARDAGLALSFEKGMRRPPPPEIVFIHRKLGGTYLLCTKLGAKLETGAMTEQFLAK